MWQWTSLTKKLKLHSSSKSLYNILNCIQYKWEIQIYIFRVENTARLFFSQMITGYSLLANKKKYDYGTLCYKIPLCWIFDYGFCTLTKVILFNETLKIYIEPCAVSYVFDLPSLSFNVKLGFKEKLSSRAKWKLRPSVMSSLSVALIVWITWKEHRIVGVIYFELDFNFDRTQ